MIRAPVRFSAHSLGSAPKSGLISALSLCLALGLTACSTAGSYPSLAYRPVERTAMPAAAEPAPPPIQLPPATADLTTRIGGLVAAAQASDKQFAAKRPAADRAVAAAARAARTSDSWISAQVAVSALQASRDTTVAALADLDSLYADARQAEPVEESPSAKAIDTARDQVQALLNGQNDVISALDARLKA
jgi:alkanesulfonate monooxygenase SsuD/methylene tetrahydromethanopterin reductase-like flavin-dependent oxidoreductase (luciferase family)